MKIPVQCPKCGAGLRVPPEVLGRTVICPKCDRSFIGKEEQEDTEEWNTRPRVATAPRPLDPLDYQEWLNAFYHGQRGLAGWLLIGMLVALYLGAMAFLAPYVRKPPPNLRPIAVILPILPFMLGTFFLVSFPAYLFYRWIEYPRSTGAFDKTR